MMGSKAAVDALRPVLARIREAAPMRDAEEAGALNAEIGWLHAAGALTEALPQALTGRAGWSDDPLSVTEVLRAVGRASLPVGRLFEGHVNAGQLVGLYGQPSLHRRCAAKVEGGALLGVWGADGAAPLHAEKTDTGFRLRGGKIFCSGLGVVGMAVVSARFDDGTCLFAVEIAETTSDPAQWNVSGMRATQSGAHDFEGVELGPDALMGKADDYFIEPHFLGGMYRICAVQAGGLEALLAALTASLRRRPGISPFLAEHRLGAVASRVSTAIAVTERLAGKLVGQGDPAAVAREAVLAREAVERCAVEALEIVERAVGTEAHRETTPISLVRRDLSFYLRQAAVDERLADVGRFLLEER